MVFLILSLGDPPPSPTTVAVPVPTGEISHAQCYSFGCVAMVIDTHGQCYSFAFVAMVIITPAQCYSIGCVAMVIAYQSLSNAVLKNALKLPHYKIRCYFLRA